MADNRISMPQSSGGIVSYHGDYKSKIELSPYLIIGFIVIVVVFELILHAIG